MSEEDGGYRVWFIGPPGSHIPLADFPPFDRGPDWVAVVFTAIFVCLMIGFGVVIGIGVAT